MAKTQHAERSWVKLNLLLQILGNLRRAQTQILKDQDLEWKLDGKKWKHERAGAGRIHGGTRNANI